MCPGAKCRLDMILLFGTNCSVPWDLTVLSVAPLAVVVKVTAARLSAASTASRIDHRRSGRLSVPRIEACSSTEILLPLIEPALEGADAENAGSCLGRKASGVARLGDPALEPWSTAPPSRPP